MHNIQTLDVVSYYGFRILISADAPDIPIHKWLV
jgi:hypothetical protein